MSKRKWWIIAATCVALIQIVLVTVFLLRKDEKTSDPSTETATTTMIAVIDPDMPSKSTVDESTTASANNVLQLTKPTQRTTSTSVNVTLPPTATAMTVATIPTNKLQVGGSVATLPPYDCETEGHHCAGPETHSYILNLELKGCRYCGEHSCASFYAVDEWGNTCFTPSKCPSYDAKKDPAQYCQACGKKCGNGYNNTCRKRVVDSQCPDCGEQVKAHACHTHG